MSKFFINRPIVAMVISILMTIVGLVAMSGLPIAQFPNIVPPQIQVNSTYTGADALTVEQAVATPIEQQMSGVDNMDYMYSINANNGQSTLYVNFDVSTDANTDQLLAQMREGQAESQLPSDVRNYGVTVKKSTSSPLVMFALYSPNGTYDNIFLANYAYININDQMTRVKGIASVTIFGAGQYAMRLWVRPDQLAKLNITIPEIINAVNDQNSVNPAGQIGAEPSPPGQEFTYAVRAQGRLVTEEDFGKVVLRANPDGSIVRVSDVARIELGAQTYNMEGRLNGKPSALIALYQVPGSNALDAADGAKKLMAKIKQSFPPDLDYVVALDTTLAVTEGVKEIQKTLFEALALVIIVVFIFLQGWRATLIPLLAVPVSLVGTFMLFDMFGFSINTLSLFGLVLAIGLVVDDAIVVVEAVEHHIENGLSPKDATLRAMSEVSGPVIAIAVILAAVFVPTAFIPGITGQLYQQFAVTIAISVIISAFNALTLSPALCALLLRPKVKSDGPLQRFYDGFNRIFGRVTKGYVGTSRLAIRKSLFSLAFLLGIAALAGLFGKTLPAGFLPDEDQGFVYAGVQLPDAGSLQRTSEIARQAEDLIKEVPGVKYVTTVVGYSMLSQVQNTYSAFFFITFEEWSKRKKPEEQYGAIKAELTRRLASISGAVGFAFPPLLQLAKVPTLRVLRRELGAPRATLLGGYLLGLLMLTGLILLVAGDIRLGAMAAAGFALAALVFWGLARLAVKLAANVRQLGGFGWRQGLANLGRHATSSTLQIAALAIGLMAMLLLTVTRAELLDAWQKMAPSDAPNRFVINIQPDQVEAMRKMLLDSQVTAELSPMIRGRLVRIGEHAVSAADFPDDDRAQRLIEREFNLSWRADLPAGNQISSGAWFPANAAGEGLASVEEGLAKTLGIGLGDVLTFNIAGQESVVKVSNLRRLEWGSMRVNFFVLMPPGVIENAPASYITSFYLPPEQASLGRELVAKFPNLTLIDVEMVLKQIQGVMDQVASAVQFIFLFTLLAGGVVLYSALMTAFDERRYELSVMRALGAQRQQLRQALLAELLVVGSIAGLIAALGASVLGQVLARQVFQMELPFNPWLPLLACLLGAGVAISVGWLAIRQLLRAPPLLALRAGAA